MSSDAGVASRSARSSSASSAAAMPSKHRRASSVCNLSRIVVFLALEIEEVAGHLLQDQCLQTLKVEQAEAQGLLDGGKEGARGIRALQLEQTAQRAHTPSVGTLLEGSGIALEARMIAAQELRLERGTAACPGWRGMMSRDRVAAIALANEPGMVGDLGAAMIDDDLGGMLVHAQRLPDQPLGH